MYIIGDQTFDKVDRPTAFTGFHDPEYRHFTLEITLVLLGMGKLDAQTTDGHGNSNPLSSEDTAGAKRH